MRFDWRRMAAKSFAVLTMGVGAGFVGGAIAFVEIGERGHLYGSPFGHIAEVIGWGVGCLTASVITFAMLYYDRGRDDTKPGPPPTRGLD